MPKLTKQFLLTINEDNFHTLFIPALVDALSTPTEVTNPQLPFIDRKNADNQSFDQLPQNARLAFLELYALGAPVLMNDWGGYFNISGENNETEVWADYYQEFDQEEQWSQFGVHNKINDLLEKYALYCEWYNAGVLGVYDR